MTKPTLTQRIIANARTFFRLDAEATEAELDAKLQAELDAQADADDDDDEDVDDSDTEQVDDAVEDDGDDSDEAPEPTAAELQLQARIAELERQNASLKAKADKLPAKPRTKSTAGGGAPSGKTATATPAALDPVQAMAKSVRDRFADA